MQLKEENISPVGVSKSDDIFVDYSNELVAIEVYLQDGIIARYLMPNYGGRTQVVNAKILGDAIYALQRGGNKYGDENSVLYRLEAKI